MQKAWARGFSAGVLAVAAVLAGGRDVGAQAPAGVAAPAPAAPTRRVIVSLRDRKLALVDGDAVVRVFPVAVGKPQTPSPVGRFTIVTRLSNPVYYRPGAVVQPGPANPLGTRWLGLDQKGYGIHGTSDPSSIGHARSKGCIRMRNADVEQLFELLRAGDIVELRDERTEELARIFGEPSSSPVATLAAASLAPPAAGVLASSAPAR